MFRFATRGVLTVGLAAFTALCFSPAPLAGQSVATGLNSLAAGGNTIAGPGILRGPTPLSLAVWRSTFPMTVCITATNVGGAVISTEFVPGPPDSLAVPRGQTISNCKQNVTSALVKCSAIPPGGACQAVWRVDLAPQP